MYQWGRMVKNEKSHQYTLASTGQKTLMLFTRLHLDDHPCVNVRILDHLAKLIKINLSIIVLQTTIYCTA